MALDPVQAIRDIALAFPEATEQETWGHPTFRVRAKIFVSAGEDGGATVLTMKAAPGEQEALLAEGDPFFLPKYRGSRGWIGVRVGADTDWRMIAELVVDSYREVAPRSLSAGIGIRPGERSKAATAFLAVGGVIGELVEGKPPKDQQVAEDVQVDDDAGGPSIELDPDDPGSSTISL